MTRRSLAGRWQFRPGGAGDWRPIEVPGCWESLGLPKDLPGPMCYRREFAVPPDWAGKTLRLHFRGVSYHCEVFVNGRRAGEHTGLWDAFRLDITGLAPAGETAELLVRVEKPASLTRGPASPAVPGRFPLKETLSGFLPYVWGHIFGGIWQDVHLEASQDPIAEGLYARGDDTGRFTVEARLSAPGEARLEILDPDGRQVHAEVKSGQELRFEGRLEDPACWSPERPARYEARLTTVGEEMASLHFGFRTLRVDGTTLTLNRQPLYPRLILSWGWYPESLHSNPGPDQVRRDFERLKALGYNGVKLCLWVPPDYYFELADELGMLLWLELPMWLPGVSDFFREQTPKEYVRIVRQVRHHPSLIVYSLGCELNREVDADLLGGLYREVKSLVGDALLRDNSGSGEAYGGLLNEFADYYDYHFYSDLQFFRGLLDSFTPRWRPEQPWLFGEFCDLDTFRDLREVDATEAGGPWWTRRDEALNPQGARWQFDLVDQESRLKENGFWERSAELAAISKKQALLHRKFTLELVRTYREVSGYVVTGERDTPISTAGMWDDRGRPKFDPAAFRAFNLDTVLALGWDKRRTWIAGGDRAAPWDTFSYPAGARVRAHLIASHYGPAAGPLQVDWQVSTLDGTELARGALNDSPRLEPGSVRELGIAEFVVPPVEAPAQVTLTARLRLGSAQVENSWPLWFFPAGPWREVAPLSLHDPLGRLGDLRELARVPEGPLDPDRVVVSSAWSSELERLVRSGGRAVVLQSDGAGPLVPGALLPFWREAVRVIEAHPAWGDFPHEGWTDLQFFGMAPDLALDTRGLGEHRPLLRRVDARTMQVHDYATEWVLGDGRLILSSLRFDGGLGEQPLGLKRNTAAAYLLSRWLRYLQRG